MYARQVGNAGADASSRELNESRATVCNVRTAAPVVRSSRSLLSVPGWMLVAVSPSIQVKMRTSRPSSSPRWMSRGTWSPAA